MPIDNPAVEVGEGHITIIPHAYNSIGQGTWVWLVDPGNIIGGVFYNSSTTNLDNLSYKVYLEAGTYTLCLLVVTHGNGGRVDIDINGAEVASFDFYSAVLARNVIKAQAGIVIAAAGLYDLKFRLDGKHASSTGYICRLLFISLWRTA